MSRLERMLNELGYNRVTIKRILRHEIGCEIWSEDELDLLSEISGYSIEDIKADKAPDIDVYRYEDGHCEYVTVEA